MDNFTSVLLKHSSSRNCTFLTPESTHKSSSAGVYWKPKRAGSSYTVAPYPTPLKGEEFASNS